MRSISTKETTILSILSAILIALFVVLLIIFIILDYRLKNIHKRFLRTITDYLVAFSLVNDDKIVICKICKLQIKKEHVIYRCPNCASFFHKTHLLMWFSIKSICPVCKYDFINELTLQNKRRIKKLNK
ncbi:MAG: hypothetical protein JXA54_01880 [Candidatus Heimdallarchaeota archaeon]|nr:hypothetical protein [Candidatus Heimdallarchaeota archaeon]